MIYIDYREKNNAVTQVLSKHNIPYQVRELPVADYIVGDIGIERKTIQDYIGSIIDGRLSNQLYELSYNFDISYLCIIGYISEAIITSKFSRKAFISSLVGSSLKRAPDGKQGQIITVNLENDYDFGYFIIYLLNKIKEQEPRLPRFKKINISKEKELIYILSSIPGIGEKRAENLLKKFGNIKSIVNAEIKDLMEVEGIGEERARRLYNIFNRRSEL